MENRAFAKVWMKCLEIARLQDFAPNTQGLLGALSGPQTPCRIEWTPLWKFLPTGLKYSSQKAENAKYVKSRGSLLLDYHNKY